MFTNKTKPGLKRGNPKANKQLFHLLYPKLKGYCKLLLSDIQQVEKNLQEYFVELHVKRQSNRFEQAIEISVFMIINRCLNELRKSKPEYVIIN